ncbi:hypothetical protein HPP92_003073 [Vanilla planifolia]|uniref:ArsA HSP20-like domain-containing protein n=1 Tax=Vanilla planifolia TaxID=51239 RepID=A0A835VGV8_VANPL|nr:hypothetical protein HPP92_003073 [Vanilla planifolia]
MDPSKPTSIMSALRYWGCAIQAGASICGALGFSENFSSVSQNMTEKMSPLYFALLPYISLNSLVDWDAILNSLSDDAKHLLGGRTISSNSSVLFDPKLKAVTLFMPGFDKSEIKLFQYRGGSELLVEAGDQRRIIHLPPGMQGKVGGAKFVDRNLIVTLR